MPVLNKHFFTMKKAIFASIIMLATLTSCNNSESQISSPEQKGAIFQSKAAARGEELPPLSKEEEKAVIDEAIETLRLDREAELKGGTGDADRKALILCHTSYQSMSGHACVYNSSGYLVSVTWGLDVGNPTYNGNDSLPSEPHIIYHGSVVPRCNC